MILETNRLFLRPWKREDVKQLYELASDSHVGPMCGWKPHQSIEESAQVLQDILINGFTYAICLKEREEVIGSIALMPYAESRYAKERNHAELGFWLGRTYWGNGYMTEVCETVIRHAFETQKLDIIWCAHNLENIASMRVQMKCGFVFHHEDKKNKLKVNYIKRKGERR